MSSTSAVKIEHLTGYLERTGWVMEPRTFWNVWTKPVLDRRNGLMRRAELFIPASPGPSRIHRLISDLAIDEVRTVKALVADILEGDPC